jgi:propionyl-CoA synthetase
MAPHPQDQVQARSLQDREAFWAKHAKELHWHKAPKRVLAQRTKKLASGASHPHWTWFPDGELSTCYNCVDRHVDAGNGSHTAIIWDSPVTGTKQRISYKELQEEVATFAAVLRNEGVRRGDVVIIYSECLGVALRSGADGLQCP